ncbi:hypothetical protein D3C78_1129840 [compost metagenome]
MGALLAGHAGITGLRLVVVLAAVDLLQRGGGADHPVRAEQAGDADQQAGAPAGRQLRRCRVNVAELLAPEAGMALLDAGQAAVQLAQLGPALALGEGAVQCGAVDLALQVAPVAFEMGLAFGGHGAASAMREHP